MINESFISKKIEASTLSDLDKNFLLNVWGLEDPFVRHLNARHHADSGFYTILARISSFLALNDNKHIVGELKTPHELSILSEDEIGQLTNPMEAMIGGLFHMFPELLKLFNDVSDISYRQFSFELNPKFKTELFEELVCKYSGTVPVDNDAFLTEIESQLHQYGHVVDLMGSAVAKYVSSEINTFYKDELYKNFARIFENSEYSEENDYWLHCYCRKADASFSGDLDMALHAWINNGYILEEMKLQIKANLGL